MHPIEELKARVHELRVSTPSREAIQRTLVREGHPEGLVSAAIEVAFDEVKEARAAAIEESNSAQRLEFFVEVLGGRDRLAAVESAGVGMAKTAWNLKILPDS